MSFAGFALRLNQTYTDVVGFYFLDLATSYTPPDDLAAFLAAGEASLSTRPADGEALESGRLKARLGEMLLERELLEAKIALLEARPGPLGRRTQKR